MVKYSYGIGFIIIVPGKQKGHLMKGIIFRGFLDFVETSSSYEMVDKIILKCNLPSGGAYTTIGTYDTNELFHLVKAFSEETNIPVSTLFQQYGEYMFNKFVTDYPLFFNKASNTFEFLTNVETHIHQEVRKIYPDASLPHFQCEALSPNIFVMVYTSSRHLADLAEGLIKGCIKHHKENIVVQREDIAVDSGSKAIFTLTKSRI